VLYFAGLGRDLVIEGQGELREHVRFWPSVCMLRAGRMERHSGYVLT
jgi:hypothetical protein